MDQVILFTTLAVYMLLAGICSIVFNKMKLPPLIGYLIAGIIIANLVGPTGDSGTIVNILSEMGLIMLMFCIGMEINLKKIRKQGVLAIEVAIVQLPLMVLGGFIAGSLLGFNFLQSICLGAIISGSSTAAVMAVLKSQNLLSKEEIDMIVLITIMEDIGQVIILSIITPMLAGGSMETGALIILILSILAFMIASILIGLKIIPRIINWISDNVEEEILVVFSVGLAYGMALLAYYVGLSVAIGAFLMGMMVASSRKSKAINHDIEPMKNIFMAMFFISVGMEISIGTLVDNIGLILIIYLVFLVLKSSTVFLGYWIGNQPSRQSFMSAVSLVAMGEFAFIIAKEALGYGIVDEAFYTSVVGAALISMILLPIMSRSSSKAFDKTFNKCPQKLMRAFMKLSHARDSVYTKAFNASKRTRKDLSKRLTHSYVCLLILAGVEIAFLLISPTIVSWGIETFGGSKSAWTYGILLVNMIAIYVPILYLVRSLKYIDLLIMDKKSRTKVLENKIPTSGINQKFINMNNSLISLFIASVFLLIIPNGIGGWEQLVVFAVAAVILFINHIFAVRKKDVETMEDDVDYDIDFDEFKKVMMERYRTERHMGVNEEPEKPQPVMIVKYDDQTPKDII